MSFQPEQMPDTSIQRAILPRMSVVLHGQASALGGALFAINWFDTRIAPIYHLYNRLAASRVFHIGAKAFFKGKVGERLAGSPELGRRHLLIVNYPSGEHFLNLVADRFFQIFSTLRMFAVKRFSFVFHKRIGGEQLLKESTQSWERSKRYGVLHFHEGEDAALAQVSRDQLTVLAERHGVLTHFSSHRAVTLSVQSKGREPEPNPYITENVLLFESEEEERLTQLFNDADFVELSSRWREYFAAHIQRTL